MIQRFDHVTVVVRDMAKAKAFFGLLERLRPSTTRGYERPSARKSSRSLAFWTLSPWGPGARGTSATMRT